MQYVEKLVSEFTLAKGCKIRDVSEFTENIMRGFSYRERVHGINMIVMWNVSEFTENMMCGISYCERVHGINMVVI